MSKLLSALIVDYLMAYLFVDNNLGDLDDVKEARTNLGLGNMSTMSSNDVLITGGKICVEDFQLNPHQDLSTSNFFLKSDIRGQAEWHRVEGFDWARSNPSEINLSGFYDDMNYVTSESLAKVSLTGDFNDISNIPQSLADVYQDDVLHKFLVIESNLSDIDDPVAARSNLGLGTLASQDSNDVRVINLIVENSITLPHVGNGFLQVDSFSNITAAPLDIATDTIPGVVLACNVNTSNPDSVPSSELLYNVQSDMKTNIDNFKLRDVNAVVDLLGDTEFLRRSNLLAEFSNDSDKLSARSNLGLGDICLQSSNDVIVNNLLVGSLEFKQEAHDKILSFDSSNSSTFVDIIDIAPPSTSNPGVVYTIADFDQYTPNELSNVSVLTAHAFKKYDDKINERIIGVKNSIPNSITDLNGDDTYLNSINNLSDVQDKQIAKSNLGLAKVASTGKYEDLTDWPIKTSSLIDDMGLLAASNNFSDIPDVVQARQNLGLGSMATQDIRNVRIEGGYVRFKQLEVKRQFLYKDDENIPNGKILVCTNNNGRMEWRDIPKASYSEYGAVKVSDHVKIGDNRTDVVPTCKTFSVIEDNITAKIDRAMQKYLSSAEFLSKVFQINEKTRLQILELNATLAKNQITFDSQRNTIFVQEQLLDERQNANISLSNQVVDLNIQTSNLIDNLNDLEGSNIEQSNQISNLVNQNLSYSNQIDALNLLTNDLEAELLVERDNLADALDKIEILEGNAYASEYGYLVNYGLSFDSNNSVKKVNNAEFFIGLNFDAAIPPSRAIIKSISSPLFGMSSNDGSIILYTQEDVNGTSNVEISDGTINIDIDPTESLHVIPLHGETNLRDAFPVNILDVSTHEGARKFKSDFDNVGSLLYSRDGIAFSGMNALCGYVQLSDKNFHAQAVSREDGIFLRRNEVIVDFIAYYHLPILFDTVKDEEDLGRYNFYMSSLISNRLNDMAYRVQTGQTSVENEIALENTSLGNFNVSFYPHIRVIKWKNEYDTAFNNVGIADKTHDFMTALGWGNPMDISTIVAKYLNTNNGSDWIRKLVELTFAHLKHGKPLKTLSATDMLVVDSIYALVTTSNFASYFQLETLQTEITFKLKKEAFSGYLY